MNYRWEYDKSLKVGRFVRNHEGRNAPAGTGSFWLRGIEAKRLNQRFKDHPELVDAYVERESYGKEYKR